MDKEENQLKRTIRAIAKRVPSLREQAVEAIRVASQQKRDRAMQRRQEQEAYAREWDDQERAKADINEQFLKDLTLVPNRRGRAALEKVLDEAQEKSDKHLKDTYDGLPESHVTKDGEEEILQLRRIEYEGKDDEDRTESWTLYFGPDDARGETIKWGNPEYIRKMFGRSFYNYCLGAAKKMHEKDKTRFATFPVPCWDSNRDVAPARCLASLSDDGQPCCELAFCQGDSKHCTAYGVACALDYLGWKDEGKHLTAMADEISIRDSAKQLCMISDYICTSVRGMSNLPKRNGFHKLVGASNCLEKLKNEAEFAVIVLEGNDHAISHSVTYAEGLIFDSTQKYPMYLTKRTLNFVCGKKGFRGIYMARTFKFDRGAPWRLNAAMEGRKLLV